MARLYRMLARIMKNINIFLLWKAKRSYKSDVLLFLGKWNMRENPRFTLVPLTFYMWHVLVEFTFRENFIGVSHYVQ